MFSIKSFSTLLMLATAAVSAPVSTSLVARGSSKRGLAFNTDQAGIAGLFTQAKSWGYNWGLKDGSNVVNEFVPMCWGESTNPGGPTFQNCIDTLPEVTANAQYLLGFNEPDYPTQANIDPATAVAKWTEIIQPYAGKVKLGAPGVTSTQGVEGRGVDNWLKPFLEQCKAAGCTIDFVPIHWYDTEGNADLFKQHCEHSRDVVRAVYPDASIWVTEFGSFLADEAKNAEFMSSATQYLDGADYIERYSAFGALDGPPSGAFMAYKTSETSSALNAIGRAYNS
ncbi:hypothetical protein EDC01DRAFT_322310 [Geopyxis carbonaria]|nr:hypothetical protein EDC01DRAFT_322310 [Geopyxis carbonaria]